MENLPSPPDIVSGNEKENPVKKRQRALTLQGENIVLYCHLMSRVGALLDKILNAYAVPAERRGPVRFYVLTTLIYNVVSQHGSPGKIRSLEIGSPNTNQGQEFQEAPGLELGKKATRRSNSLFLLLLLTSVSCAGSSQLFL